MKGFTYLLSLILICTINSSPGFGQCDPDKYIRSSIELLPEEFTFLKTFKIDGQGGEKEKIEYSYVFSKNTNYSINIEADGEKTDGIVVSMYDANRQRVATNLVDGTFYQGIQSPCKATGIYYITFTFKDSGNHCGGSVLGFKR